jgi:hypothetical protein
MLKRSDTHSIIVFTLHKSASMFLHDQSKLLSELSGIAYHSPNNPGSDLEPRRLLSDKTIWTTRHGCFSPIRFYVDVPNLEDFQVILHLRDPRDVLVSMFYSYCYIHPGELAGNTGYRKDVADQGIDSFVLNKASGGTRYIGNYGTGGHAEDQIGNIKKRYENYVERLLGKPNVALVKYEEMVTDYRKWLEKFSAPFPLGNRESVINELVSTSRNFFPSRTQDVMAHVRHVTPGDHKEKLNAATIRKLDVIFGDVLDSLGYAKSS